MKEEPKTWSMRCFNPEVISSRQRLLIAIEFSPVNPCANRATSSLCMKSSAPRAVGKCCLTLRARAAR